MGGTMHLVIGPVGAGKSTFARRKSAAESTVFLDADTWMVRLFGNDARPEQGVMQWYLERRDRCRALLWDLGEQILDTDSDVIVEPGLVTVAERAEFYARAAAAEIPYLVYLLDAERDVRRERVASRNRSSHPHVQQVPASLFELASDAWEPITDQERAQVNLVELA